MKNVATTLIVVALSLLPAAGLAAVEAYSQNFEDLIQPDPDALGNDGWLVFGNVSTPGGAYLYGYGPFPAPNHPFAFSQIDINQGGPDQGFQQLSVFSDYENLDHANGNLVESNVFQEQTIEAGNVGEGWIFAFDAKKGNIEGSSTAQAFIKVIDPNNNFNLTRLVSVDMTAIPDTWTNYSLGISIDSGLVGQLLQFGFLCVATDYEGSGIFYDNVFFGQATIDVPAGTPLVGAELKQNYPNPFNPSTKIDFALERSSQVDVTVYDVAGRKVTTLHNGELGAGPHSVTWNGRSDRGAPVSAGQYWYVLTTAEGQVSRRMVLVK